MRPRGEVREAIYAAAMARDVGGATFIELADDAQVSREHARETVKDMVRAGDLTVIGKASREHSRRFVNIYAPACTQPGLAEGQGPPLGASDFGGPQSFDCSGSDALAFVMRGWPRC